MRALITGANGFLGSTLARTLAARGDSVACLVRDASAPALRGLSVEIHEGDVRAPSTLDAAMKNAEVVFHLAGIRRAPERRLFFEINAEGTRNVCEAMLRSGARRLVLCSSLAAVGPSRAPKSESDPLAPEEFYGESKAEAERIALAYRDRLEVAIARPARITGPGDKENLVFFKLVKKGVRLSFTGGPRPLATVDVDDTCELLILLAERPEAVGEAFFATGPDLTTFEALQDLVAEVLGEKPFPVVLPATVLLGLSACADWASKLTGKHLPLNRKLARQLLAPGWNCSPKKSEMVLGFRPRRTLDDSIRRSAAWYQREGWL